MGLIKAANFEYAFGKVFTCDKYHKNTLCKVLENLKNRVRQNLFF